MVILFVWGHTWLCSQGSFLEGLCQGLNQGHRHAKRMLYPLDCPQQAAVIFTEITAQTKEPYLCFTVAVSLLWKLLLLGCSINVNQSPTCPLQNLPSPTEVALKQTRDLRGFHRLLKLGCDIICFLFGPIYSN